MEESLGTKNNYSNELLNLDNDYVAKFIYKELLAVQMEFFSELEQLFNNDKVMISDIENLKDIVEVKRKNILNKLVSYIENKVVR
jgi:acetylglutamate kinase